MSTEVCFGAEVIISFNDPNKKIPGHLYGDICKKLHADCNTRT